MTAKDKKDPYKEVAESLDLGESDGTPGFDSVSLDKASPGSDNSAEADEGAEEKVNELTKIVGVAGKTEKVACEVYSGVKSYASRTSITLPKPVTTENTKFKSKFRKKRKS